MKPQPFSSLNHFTLPTAIGMPPLPLKRTATTLIPCALRALHERPLHQARDAPYGRWPFYVNLETLIHSSPATIIFVRITRDAPSTILILSTHAKSSNATVQGASENCILQQST